MKTKELIYTIFHTAFDLKSILVLLLVVFPFIGKMSAQHSDVHDQCEHAVKGKIVDADTKDPLPFVLVQVIGSEKATVSDEHGDFLLEGLCSSENDIVFSCTGYCDTTCTNYHKHGSAPHVHLKTKINSLDDFVIAAEAIETEGTQSISSVSLKGGALEGASSLGQALSNVDGVTFASTGNNVQIPVLHGLYGNRVLTLNNGLKHGFQNWGSDHAPEIDVRSAEDITVIKGAAGVRYGPDALGGAIIVNGSPLYLNENFYAKIRAGFESNGGAYHSGLSLGEGKEKWSYHIGTNYSRSGDRRAPDYVLTNTGKEDVAFNAGVRYRMEKFDVRLYYSYLDQNLALLRSSVAESGNAFVRSINADRPEVVNPFSYRINEPNQLINHQLAKAEVKWKYSDEGQFTFTAGYQQNQRQEFDVRRNAEKPIIDLDLVTRDLQLEWKHPEWGRLHGVAGVQFFGQNNDNNPGTGTTAFIPNYNSNRYSVFLIENLEQGKNTFEFGFRVDQENNDVRGRTASREIFRDNYDLSNVTYSLGYIREISDRFSFRTNIGSAWRAPNMAELYSFGQHGFRTIYGLLRYSTDDEGSLSTNGVSLASEIGLRPEKGYKWINEWNLSGRKHEVTITAYAHLIQNFIFERPIAVLGTIRGPMPGFIYEQSDAAFTGIDITWRQDWSNTMKGVFGASGLWSRNIERSETLIQQPPITTHYKLTLTPNRSWIFDETSFFIKGSYVFRQFQAPQVIDPELIIDGSVLVGPETEIFDFREAPEEYFLIDLGWEYRYKDFSGTIGIQNATNRTYRDYLNQMRYFADELGVNFLFSIKYNFNNKNR